MKYFVAIGALVAGIMGAAVSGGAEASADTYYGCRGGFEFQVRGNAARCYKPAQTEWRGHERCLPGQRLVRDYRGRRDMCVTGIGVAAIVVPPACARGWSLISRDGREPLPARRSGESRGTVGAAEPLTGGSGQPKASTA